MLFFGQAIETMWAPFMELNYFGMAWHGRAVLAATAHCHSFVILNFGFMTNSRPQPVYYSYFRNYC